MKHLVSGGAAKAIGNQDSIYCILYKRSYSTYGYLKQLYTDSEALNPGASHSASGKTAYDLLHKPSTALEGAGTLRIYRFNFLKTNENR